MLPRRIAKQSPGFLQSIAQSHKDSIQLKIRNLKFTLDIFLAYFKQAVLSTNTVLFLYSAKTNTNLNFWGAEN